MDKYEFITALMLAVLLPFPLGLVCVIVDVKTHFFTNLVRKLFDK